MLWLRVCAQDARGRREQRRRGLRLGREPATATLRLLHRMRVLQRRGRGAGEVGEVSGENRRRGGQRGLAERQRSGRNRRTLFSFPLLRRNGSMGGETERAESVRVEGGDSIMVA